MKFWVKRIVDFIFALLGLVILIPSFALIAIVINQDSKGGIIYKQVRVGLNRRNFKVWKFRTMYTMSDKVLNLTVGNNDLRITKVGLWLRKYKLDELPQLVNVLVGDMSFVGPRPEVVKYVDLYSEEQLQVLSMKPGITDLASIRYRNENELLASVEDPENYYINVLMPEKLNLNLFYIRNQSLLLDIKLIIKTIIFIFVKS